MGVTPRVREPGRRRRRHSPPEARQEALEQRGILEHPPGPVLVRAEEVGERDPERAERGHGIAQPSYLARGVPEALNGKNLPILPQRPPRSLERLRVTGDDRRHAIAVLVERA